MFSAFLRYFFCVETNLKLLFNSLNVSLRNLLVLKINYLPCWVQVNPNYVFKCLHVTWQSCHSLFDTVYGIDQFAVFFLAPVSFRGLKFLFWICLCVCSYFFCILLLIDLYLFQKFNFFFKLINFLLVFVTSWYISFWVMSWPNGPFF